MQSPLWALTPPQPCTSSTCMYSVILQRPWAASLSTVPFEKCADPWEEIKDWKRNMRPCMQSFGQWLCARHIPSLISSSALLSSTVPWMTLRGLLAMLLGETMHCHFSHASSRIQPLRSHSKPLAQCTGQCCLRASVSECSSSQPHIVLKVAQCASA